MVNELQSTVENVKYALYLSSTFSNHLIVIASRHGALDQHISDLNQQRQQLV